MGNCNKKDEYAELKKNTVSAYNQLRFGNGIRIENNEGKGKRIMFVGNSITLHGPNEEIGWHGDWGMSASTMDKDYVHVLERMVNEIDKDAAFCMCQVATWERGYKNGGDYHKQFEAARDFNADIIVLRFIENCPASDMVEGLFEKEYIALANYLNKSGKAQIIATTGFWKGPGDRLIRNAAKMENYPLIELGELGDNPEMKAIGLFEHTGVANHPGDKGMEHIALYIFEELKKYL